MTKKSLHVVSSTGGNWSVRTEGASKASRVFDTQGDAVTHAKKLARDANTGVFIHRKDGRVRESISYGQEFAPVKKK